jgi:hypothetical protein
MRATESWCLALLLAACETTPEALPPPRQLTLDWPEQHRLLVADNRQGVVRAFSTFDTPRAAGEARAPGRRAVLDLALDKAAGRLWVRGPDAVYLHDAVSLALIRTCPSAAWPPAPSGPPCPG